MSTKILRAGYVVTDPGLRENGVLVDGAICVRDSVIIEVDSFPILHTRYPEANVIGSANLVALPGFIDAHNHGQGVTTFGLGAIDDMLEVWAYYLSERAARSAEEVYWDVLLAAARQIRSGVTTSMRHDTTSFPLPAYRTETEAVVDAYKTSGLRLAYALGTTDQFRLVYDDNERFVTKLPSEMQSVARSLIAREALSVDEYLNYFDEIYRRHTGTPRINFLTGVIGPQWDSDGLLIRMRDKAKELGTGMHGPLLETLYQKLYAEREFGHSAAEHFYQLGLLGPDYSCAHGVWLSEKDIELFAETGSTVVHCPSSNLRLYSGIAPIPLMLAKGVNVALSVDSEGINDDDDTFQEMRLAMMLHRYPGKIFQAPDEWDVLKMATTNGARAVLLQDRIGTLQKGKEADVVLIKLDRIVEPYLDSSVGPIAALVYRGRPEDVDMVMVAGEVIYEKGQFTRFDEADAKANLERIIGKTERLAEKAGYARRLQLMPFIRKYYSNWRIPELEPVQMVNSKC